MSRINALIRKCRNRGGDCSCALRCQAKDEVMRELIEAEQAMGKATRRHADAKALQKHLESQPRTVKPGWKLPEKPPGDYVPAVYFDSDGCSMYWHSDTEPNDCIEMERVGEDCWPFIEDYAWSEDWERLGFTVID